MRRMPITAVLGEQRGDEGKGRFVDMLAAEHDIVARFNGGANAGHQVGLPDGAEHTLHLLPSGIAYDHTLNVIGNGTVVDPVKLLEEIRGAKEKGIDLHEGRLMISSGAHLLLPYHVSIDEIREAGSGAQGSTKSGIAPVYADKAMRTGIRMEIINNDLGELRNIVETGINATNPERERVGLEPLDCAEITERYIAAAACLGRFVTFTQLVLNERLSDGKRLLAEGAQAFLLDNDHGMYPMTTSSSTTIGGVFTGLGVSPRYLEDVVGVAKAIPSHVGGGPFVTRITDEAYRDQLDSQPGTIDSERGKTTGRKRDLGYLDLAVLRAAHMVNGTSEMALTKLDCVPRFGEQVLICTGYTRKDRELSIAPDAAYKLDQSSAIFESLPTWEEDISGVREFGDLPPNAQNYIRFIEQQTGAPITMIGVGPYRDQVIDRRAA